MVDQWLEEGFPVGMFAKVLETGSRTQVGGRSVPVGAAERIEPARLAITPSFANRHLVPAREHGDVYDFLDRQISRDGDLLIGYRLDRPLGRTDLTAGQQPNQRRRKFLKVIPHFHFQNNYK